MTVNACEQVTLRDEPEILTAGAGIAARSGDFISAQPFAALCEAVSVMAGRRRLSSDAAAAHDGMRAGLPPKLREHGRRCRSAELLRRT